VHRARPVRSKLKVLGQKLGQLEWPDGHALAVYTDRPRRLVRL